MDTPTAHTLLFGLPFGPGSPIHAGQFSTQELHALLFLCQAEIDRRLADRLDPSRVDA